MAYTPYYNDGWQSGEEGGTPITPDALNHMEAGIEDANNNTVPVTRGGTGATTAAGARTNLEITPANIGAFSGASLTNLVRDVTISANASANITLSDSVTNYIVLIVGQNDYANSGREGFDGRNNVYLFPKAFGAENQYARLVSPDGSWHGWFLSNTSIHVINDTSNTIVFRIDGIN